MMSHSEQVAPTGEQKSVFESQPQQSKAAVGYGTQAQAETSAPSVFESQPRESQAQFRSNAEASGQGDNPSVFESQPQQSKANYKAGVAKGDSDSEYETDDEKEAK